MPILTSLALGAARGFGFGIGGAALLDVVTTFTSSRTFTVPEGVTEVEYLIVSGGGGGGGQGATAGAGAGGVRLGSGLPVTAGTTLTFSVGAGGAHAGLGTNNPGSNGVGSSITGVPTYGPVTNTTIGSNGGGGGGSGDGGSATKGHHGGSGGGGGGGTNGGALLGGRSIVMNTANGHSTPLTGENISRGTATIQGFNGGASTPSGPFGAGGGGGAAQDGFGAGPVGGNGGNGLASTIVGATQFYGGGGGGGDNVGGLVGQMIGGIGGGGNAGRDGPIGLANGEDGAAFSGGGAGGGSYNPTYGIGGTGGSGIIIIKYKAANQKSRHIFTSSTSFEIPKGYDTDEYLVVAGGGGGGRGGGGGGAGGARIGTGFSVTGGDTIAITVGAGGVGSLASPISYGSNGANSVFSTISSTGGRRSRI